MSDPDLNRLFELPLDRSLGGLERSIWLGVAARERDRRTSRLAVACQAGVLAIAVAIGGMAGATAAAGAREDSGKGPLLLAAQHAPSNLLLGSPR